MYGVSAITTAEERMLIGYSGADALFMGKTLNALAAAGVVVDMISQTPPMGKSIRFSFTAASRFFDAVLKAVGGEGVLAPMISQGYAKINLFGEEMVESAGVAARALAALGAGQIEVSMITTSDLDISLLIRQEDVDVAVQLLRDTYKV